MGEELKHPGPPEALWELKERLLSRPDLVMHWYVCTDCDPEDWVVAMLKAVGLTMKTYLSEVAAHA